MKIVAFDPEKHKGCEPLIKKNIVMMTPGHAVRNMRANGWKTRKEWERVEGKRARKELAVMLQRGATPGECAVFLDKKWREGLALGVYEPGPAESVVRQAHHDSDI